MNIETEYQLGDEFCFSGEFRKIVEIEFRVMLDVDSSSPLVKGLYKLSGTNGFFTVDRLRELRERFGERTHSGPQHLFLQLSRTAQGLSSLEVTIDPSDGTLRVVQE